MSLAWAGWSPLKCQVQSLSSPSSRDILCPLTYYSGSVAPSEQGHCSVFKQQSLEAAIYQFYSLMGKERNQTRWDTCQTRWHRGHRVQGPSVPDMGLPLTSVWEKALQEDILYQNRWRLFYGTNPSRQYTQSRKMMSLISTCRRAPGKCIGICGTCPSVAAKTPPLLKLQSTQLNVQAMEVGSSNVSQSTRSPQIHLKSGNK